MPLVWDTNNILYETLVSDLLIWQISGRSTYLPVLPSFFIIVRRSVRFKFMAVAQFDHQILRWKGLLNSLRCLERLLSRKQTRERFIATCIGPQHCALGEDLPFRHFAVKLGGLRWQVVTKFCLAAIWQLQIWFQCSLGLAEEHIRRDIVNSKRL